MRSSHSHEPIHTFSQSTRDPLVDIVVGTIGGFVLLVCFVFTVRHIRDRVTASRRTSFAAEKSCVMQVTGKVGEDGDVPVRTPTRRRKPAKISDDDDEGSAVETVSSFSKKKMEQAESQLSCFNFKGKHYAIKMQQTSENETRLVKGRFDDTKEMEALEVSTRSKYSSESDDMLSITGRSCVVLVTDLQEIREKRDLQTSQGCHRIPSYFVNATTRDLFWIDSQGDMHRVPRIDHRVDFAGVSDELIDTYRLIAEIEGVFVVEDDPQYSIEEEDEENQANKGPALVSRSRRSSNKGFGQLLQSMFSNYLPPIVECPSLEDLIGTPISSPHQARSSFNGTTSRSGAKHKSSPGPHYSPVSRIFEHEEDRICDNKSRKSPSHRSHNIRIRTNSEGERSSSEGSRSRTSSASNSIASESVLFHYSNMNKEGDIRPASPTHGKLLGGSQISEDMEIELPMLWKDNDASDTWAIQRDIRLDMKVNNGLDGDASSYPNSTNDEALHLVHKLT